MRCSVIFYGNRTWTAPFLINGSAKPSTLQPQRSYILHARDFREVANTDDQPLSRRSFYQEDPQLQTRLNRGVKRAENSHALRRTEN
ncbi:hypothetical protein L208DRAFT_1411315 [Tricholoma matsutake]|nr:hypothetical protein L208DRAFT_1411315 [Tricholoma matsutake 945]